MMVSKLPHVGTTIFTTMSRRARELGALNLGQGFPDYPIDPRLTELVAEAMTAGYNQYAPMEGTVELRAQISRKLNESYGVRPDVESQITVTLGATEALFSSIHALIGPGDEAIIFDPSYDAYEPAITLTGANCIRIPLMPPEFRYDWDRIRDALTKRTRLIIINTPHNPTCTVATQDDLDRLAEITRGRDIKILSDEVYEHVLFDGRRHVSVLTHAELADRSIAVFSFGKTLHATGIRVGYAVGPAALTAELRKVHQFNTFSIGHPFQHAIGKYLVEKPASWRNLAAFFQAKRDRLCSTLTESSFGVTPAAGTYFQLLDFDAMVTDAALRSARESAKPLDVLFAEELLTKVGIATIPLSPFYKDPPKLTFLRLCIAKRDETLDEASRKLKAISSKK